jgi:Ca2+-transporting ATPase
MAEPPRDKDARILPRQLALWLLFVGLVFAAVTLAVIVWATDAFDVTVGHTMGLVTFSLFHVFFSLETADENRTIFSSELFDNPALLKATGASLLTIFLATTFGPLQRILDTTELSVDQWAICIAAAATILVVTEIRKVFRRRGMAGTEAASQPALAGQTP